MILRLVILVVAGSALVSAGLYETADVRGAGPSPFTPPLLLLAFLAVGAALSPRGRRR